MSENRHGPRRRRAACSGWASIPYRSTRATAARRRRTPGRFSGAALVMYQSLSPPLHCRLTHRIAYVHRGNVSGVRLSFEVRCDSGFRGILHSPHFFFVPPTPHGIRLLRENCAIHRIRDHSHDKNRIRNHRGRAAGGPRAATRGPTRHGPTRAPDPGPETRANTTPAASRQTTDLTRTAHDSRVTPRTVRPVPGRVRHGRRPTGGTSRLYRAAPAAPFTNRDPPSRAPRARARDGPLTQQPASTSHREQEHQSPHHVLE